MPAIQACGTSSAEFAEYIVDGVPYHFASPPDNFMGGDSTGTCGIYTNKTNVHGYQAATNTGGFGIVFLNNFAVGTLPVDQGFFNFPPGLYTSHFVNPSPVVNITSFGPVGGFIEGNFNEVMDFAGIPKTVICNFRVRR
jgi:hypothetical protein